MDYLDLKTQWSKQISSESVDDAVQMELQLLEEIYYEELEVDRNSSGLVTSLRLLLKPSVGESGDDCYVCMTLVLRLPDDYPHASPTICVRSPRGLSEAHVESILDEMRRHAQQQLGTPCLYSLIDLAKDSLSDNNRPSGQCSVCLTLFEDEDTFHKTPCYHFFHAHCLLAYSSHWRKQLQEASAAAAKDAVRGAALQSGPDDSSRIPCPVCRSSMMVTVVELEELASGGNCVSGDDKEHVPFQPSEELKAQQRQMQKVLEHQRAKGGLIDKSVNNTVETFDLNALSNLSLVPTKPQEEGSATSPLQSQGKAEVDVSVRAGAASSVGSCSAAASTGRSEPFSTGCSASPAEARSSSCRGAFRGRHARGGFPGERNPHRGNNHGNGSRARPASGAEGGRGSGWPKSKGDDCGDQAKTEHRQRPGRGGGQPKQSATSRHTDTSCRGTNRRGGGGGVSAAAHSGRKPPSSSAAAAVNHSRSGQSGNDGPEKPHSGRVTVCVLVDESQSAASRSPDTSRRIVSAESSCSKPANNTKQERSHRPRSSQANSDLSSKQNSCPGGDKKSKVPGGQKPSVGGCKSHHQPDTCSSSGSSVTATHTQPATGPASSSGAAVDGGCAAVIGTAKSTSSLHRAAAGSATEKDVLPANRSSVRPPPGFG